MIHCLMEHIAQEVSVFTPIFFLSKQFTVPLSKQFLKNFETGFQISDTFATEKF